MAATLVSDGRADQIYRIGPEDLVAASSTIVAGPVSGYMKDVTKYSQPGPNGFPLEWVASGRIDRPIVIKGDSVSGPISFSRTERSFFVPADPETPIWEQNAGDVSREGEVVLFLRSEDPSRPFNVLPSSPKGLDLVELAKVIVEIQAIRDPIQQRQSWLRVLASARTDEGRRVALRSMIHSGANWNQMAPPLKALFSDPGLNDDMKAFAFGFVAFYVTEGRWAEDTNLAVDFLCQTFTGQEGLKLELQYLQSLKIVLRYTVEEPREEFRQPLRKNIMDTLEQRASLGPADPTLKEEYKRIHEQYGIR